MIGDPKQLPATIISQTAVSYGYDQSLFQRLQLASYPVCMLNVQYRMHPALRAFPSSQFYMGQLVDSEGMLEKRQQQYHQMPCFGPFVVYDVPFSEETKTTNGSTYNEDEAKMALLMYQLLVESFPEIDFRGRVGIISPYKQQVLLLRDLFQAKVTPDHYAQLNIDTVDGFQGREKEIVIVSCVRAPTDGSGVGFLSDVRRMNVLLTRPQSSLIVIGNANALNTDPDWGSLVQHAKDTSSFVRVTSPMEKCVAQLTNTEFFSQLVATSAEVTLSENQSKKHARKKKDTAEHTPVISPDDEDDMVLCNLQSRKRKPEDSGLPYKQPKLTT